MEFAVDVDRARHETDDAAPALATGPNHTPVILKDSNFFIRMLRGRTIAGIEVLHERGDQWKFFTTQELLGNIS